MIFPTRGIDKNLTLKNLDEVLIWYSKINPRKKDTGLFFFHDKPNENFAICNAGGGFCYVGAMHDSFPHAPELSKRGYNAFALIYRPDAQLACEDLARAIAFVHEHAAELQIDTKNTRGLRKFLATNRRLIIVSELVTALLLGEQWRLG